MKEEIKMKYRCLGCDWNCELEIQTHIQKIPQKCPYDMEKVNWRIGV